MRQESVLSGGSKLNLGALDRDICNQIASSESEQEDPTCNESPPLSPNSLALATLGLSENNSNTDGPIQASLEAKIVSPQELVEVLGLCLPSSFRMLL